MDNIFRADMLANLKAIASDHQHTLDMFKQALNANKTHIVYIAGKVTGLPYKEVYEKFEKRQLELEAKGFIVINPCKFVRQNEDWKTAMQICIVLLQYADYICRLPDYNESAGARLEWSVAIALNIPPFPSKGIWPSTSEATDHETQQDPER